MNRGSWLVHEGGQRWHGAAAEGEAGDGPARSTVVMLSDRDD